MVKNSFSIKTLGCKLNQYESNRIASILAEDGLVPVKFGEPADHVVINTCTVTDASDHKCRQYIRSGARSASNGKVVVTGCMANRIKDEILTFPEVCAVFTSDESAMLISSLSGVLHTEESVQLPINRARAQIKIQDGCDGTCAYCIIPAVRGLPRSRTPEEIIREVRVLIDSGFRELVMTGITIGKYSSRGDNLASLLLRIAALDGDFRIRVTSIEPVHVTDALLDVYSHPRICPHIHLPLQGGNDETLSRMNRPYKISQYAGKVEALRRVDPDMAIGTDMIVGFPGESENAFSSSLEFVSSIGFSYIHQFTFSPREGTPAAAMPRTESHSVITDRFSRLKKVAIKSRTDYVARFYGRTMRCTLEKRKKSLRALTPHYLHAVIPEFRNDVKSGDFADVTILETGPSGITGRISEY